MPATTDALLKEEGNGILTSFKTRQPETSSPAGLCHISHTQISSVSRSQIWALQRLKATKTAQ